MSTSSTISSLLTVTVSRKRVYLKPWRRYFEHYSPTHGEWVQYRHRVTTNELVHWMMAKGLLHIEHTPQAPANGSTAGQP